MNNILVVDDIVRKTEEMIYSFYGDKDTSFIFTADHGMSKIGNHGDGGQQSSSCLMSSLSHLHLACSYVDARSGQYPNAADSLGLWNSRSSYLDVAYNRRVFFSMETGPSSASRR